MLDGIVPALMKKHDVPGVALTIVRGDSIVALKGYGVAPVRDSARMDPTRTLFRLASVSSCSSRSWCGNYLPAVF